MKEMAITMSMAKTVPNYRKTAGLVLDACRKFYQMPENETAFQEWMKQRKEGKHERQGYEKAV